MTHQARIDPDVAFVPLGTPMFADLIVRLGQEQSLNPTRRRDMISGLNRVAKTLGRAPQDVPCHTRWLQPRLSKISPAAFGLTPKTWQNAVSNARAAMVHVGIVERRANRITDLSQAWQKLWSGLLASPQSATLQPALCRFVYFLSNQGIAPGKVRIKHAQAYKDALIRNEISKSPDVAYRAAVNGWNLAVRSLPRWPRTKLPLEQRQKIIKLAESDFPAAFLADLDHLILRLSQPDPLAENGRAKALRPTTLKQYRRQVIRFASELVHAGVPVEKIDSIAVLLTREMAERGLRQMLTRTENKTIKMISEVAALLRNLGRITGQDDATQKQLTKIAGRVATQPQRGMTAKNRNRLRVLQNDKSMMRLLELPERVFNRPPPGKSNDYTKALAREDAVAIAILLACPIRIKNLAGIHLEQHIQRPGDGRAYLVLTEDDLKNERPIEFELPKDVVRMIDRHLVTRCPHMCPAGTPWLFPRRDGMGPMVPGQLSTRIKTRVFKVTGLEVNSHLFRHTAVMNWLDAYPGAYEVARRLLGHSDVSHTINLYSGLEVKSATRAFADLMEAKKGQRK
ncbi:site-specific integrase [Sediminimonas qiaohouensis]|uniref:site-specific integrase n=1 Tax=Sediminimonas qiaohouensis TaxID=552061 RepID=UPI00040CFFCB|nr:site-specific integrase [Sediminimonas qiaohouensis]